MRSWGDWTEVKLDALESYLHGFALACSRADRTLYLDLFAGAASNQARSDGREIAGSSERAVRTSPPFTKLILGEIQERNASALRDHFRAEFPSRDVEVLAGDCNHTFPRRLRQLGDEWRWAPTFAFVDQYSAEIRWETLEALADFRHGSRKVELWLYFGDSFLPRGLGVADIDEEFASRVEAMFGTDQWREIWRARCDGLLEPAVAKHELVNLMRWRLEKELGYATTLPLQIVNQRGQPLYTLIFATDHGVGEKIMTHVFSGAQDDLAAMVARSKLRTKLEAADQRRGMEGLFDLDVHMQDVGRASAAARPPLDPPLPPWRWAEQLRD